MIRLSIIIPFYNVEQYIAQCLDSVYQQDIPEDEYEVICVNDASPDHSRDIVIEYQKSHKNLMLIEHKTNRKLGAARNTGRSIAKGKYVWNVDSDDYIIENCLGSILSRCERDNLDIMMFNFMSNKENTIYETDFPLVTHDTYQDGLTTLNQNIAEIGHFCPVWRYVYSKEFLDKHSIYSPRINMGEDVPYAFKALLLAKRVLLVNELYYCYRINPTSLTGVKTLQPTVLYEKCFVAARLVCDLLKYIPKNDTALQKIFENMVKSIVYMYPKYMAKMSTEDKNKFSRICKRHILDDFSLFQLMNRAHKLEYIKFLVKY